MGLITKLLAVARFICIFCALFALVWYPVDPNASAITTTIFLLSSIASGLECILSTGFLFGILMENPLPHTHLRNCAVLIYLEWHLALITVGSGCAAIMVTKIAMGNSIRMDNYKETMRYSLLVFAAGVFGSISAFFNVILGKILRHPPPANHPQ